ncbi:hypothetical protein AAFF_G00014490 [Aldrovandia affinis]|uniref:Uncharacterized protein n=1 Tax=Aldrovandia affinis TaxID=143900 RepID=A0AAD7R2P9_9TELE|nr:hypothetical protein AAFF_G00014490 [Aldrovandia affinis]
MRGLPTVRVAVESSPAREQPEWVGAMMERMTELVRAVTLQPQGGAARSPGPMRCWGVAGPAIASGTAAIARRSRESGRESVWRAERTPGAMSHADLSPAEGAKRHSWEWGSTPPGAGDGAESVMVVGWTHAGNFAMSPSPWLGRRVRPWWTRVRLRQLMRPDMVPVGTQLEQASVQLRTVTGASPHVGEERW